MVAPATNTLFPKNRTKRSSNRTSRKFWNVPPTGRKVFQDSRIIERGKPPVVMEPVKATIKIDRPGKVTVYILDHDGVRTDRTVPVQDGQFTIDGARDKTPYYLVVYSE